MNLLQLLLNNLHPALHPVLHSYLNKLPVNKSYINNIPNKSYLNKLPSISRGMSYIASTHSMLPSIKIPMQGAQLQPAMNGNQLQPSVSPQLMVAKSYLNNAPLRVR